MSIRIGIVGPADSVKQIMTVTKEFPDVHFTPFVYENVYQVDELLLNNLIPIDQWFFSGVLNYHYALEKQLVDQEYAIFPPLYGSSFFGTLLEAQLKANKVFKSISIDSIANDELEKTLSFYDLEALQFKNFPFSDYTYIHDLTNFHEELYRAGKTDLAVTFTNYAYVRLKEKNIPVYRMKPSYLSVKLTLNVLIERAYAKRLKKTQIGIIGCFADFQVDEEDIYYPYQMKQEELDLKKELLFLAKEVRGSFISLGNGLYLIYTNRGEIRSETRELMVHLSKKMKSTHKLPIYFSIGYGDTASSAEQHARLGLRNRRDGTAIVIVEEDKQISILGKEDLPSTLQYSVVSLGEEWEEKIKDLGVSVSTVSRLISLSSYYHKREFSSQDVSRWLNCSLRNARRILKELERGDVLKQCGEIHTGGRGRPLKLYCFYHP